MIKNNSLLRIMMVFLLASLSMSGYSDTEVTKDWSWSTDESKFYFASTGNESDHIFGQYCYFDIGVCMYLVYMEVICEKGREYPGIINSDAGSTKVKLVCAYDFRNSNTLIIQEFDDVDKIVRNAKRLGIVMPMNNGIFKVSRFSLVGADHAIDTMRTAAKEHMKNAPRIKDEIYL